MKIHKKKIDDLTARIPFERFAQSDEITNLVLFLASDEASYYTGAEFTEDGGLTAKM